MTQLICQHLRRKFRFRHRGNATVNVLVFSVVIGNCIVFNDDRQQNRVGNAVRHIEKAAERMCHRMHIAETRP